MCHPTYSNKCGADRDSIQPLQYQGNQRPLGAGGSCRVCHGEDMEDMFGWTLCFEARSAIV